METVMRSTRRKREQFKQLKRLTEAQAALGWGVILILAALLGAIYLSQTSRIAVVGRRVQNLQGQLEDLKRENGTIERQIAEAQSLARLQQEALRLGFTQARPDDIDYIIVPDYPAAAGTTASEVTGTAVPPTTPPPETIGEVLWLTLQNSIANLVYGEASE